MLHDSALHLVLHIELIIGCGGVIIPLFGNIGPQFQVSCGSAVA